MICRKLKPGIDGCIKVDFDTAKPKQANCVTVLRLLRTMAIEPEWIRWDRTRRGWHMVIKPMQPVNLFAAQGYEFGMGEKRQQQITELLVQSILGDDSHRGAHNYRRATVGIFHNVLYEPIKKGS